MDRKQINKKHGSAMILTVLLLLVSGAVLFYLDQMMTRKKVNERNQAKLDFIAEQVSYFNSTAESGKSLVVSTMQENVRFMTMALAEELEENGNIARRLFSDGAVAERSGDQLVFPEGVPAQLRQLTKEDLQNSISTGLKLTSNSDTWLIRSEAISEDLYYVSWKNSGTDTEDPYACLRNEEFQKLANQSFSGLLLGSEGGNGLSLIFESPEAFDIYRTLNQSAICTSRPQTIRAGGSSWICMYSPVQNGERMLVWLLPEKSVYMRSIFQIGLIIISELIIFVTLITYFFSVLSYCISHELTKNEAEVYHPKKLRKFLLTAAGAGALVIFVCACVFQTMETIHTESILGAQELGNLLEYSEKMMSERNAEEKQNEEQRILDHGERIAAVLAGKSEPVTREKLQEYCYLFGFDYLILFDTDGREIVSSADYVGLTMDAGLGENSRDFRRLLRGVPAIAHELSYDSVTGLERQFLGVRVPAVTTDGKPGYGALLMALDPQGKSAEKLNPELPDLFDHFRNGSQFCFYADPESGKILRASDSSLVGKTVMSLGLPERSLQEGYTDFTVFNNVSAYTTMVKLDTSDFFYVIYDKELFNRTIPIASAVLLLYLVKGMILGWYCLSDFSAEKYEALIAEKSKKYDDNKAKVPDRFSGSMVDYSELVIGRNRKDSRWGDKTPEGQVGMILKIDVLLLVILPLIVFVRIYGDSSLIRYIMAGNWMRGFNMFSFCAIIIVWTIGIMSLIVSNAILSLIAGLTGRAGETACRMLYSLIYYLVILNIIYHVFEYAGLAMSTYVASLGAASLALSIGAQGMVADILAGLLIVFENQFQVGDIVEIEGYTGKVLEIGVRSTRILGPSNDVRFISNSEIRSIINKSMRNSLITKEYSFITNKSLDRIEVILISALSAVEQQNSIFIRGPVFVGFGSTIQNGKERIVTVRIKYECTEEDSYRAENFINREIMGICEREDIGLK